MKNKEKYDLTKLIIKWKGGESIEVFDKENNLFSAFAYTDKRLLESYLEWLEDEYKAPILDEKEREYLKSFIRPWKHLTVTVKKTSNYYGERIVISYLNKNLSYFETISLPIFERNTMYKGMELNKDYTLEDLGLWK